LNKILIVYHSQSGVVERMAYAVKEGIEKIGNFEVVLKKAEQANQDDLKTASGIAIGTPDYFDYMAGTVKDFFDRTFYPVQSRIAGSLTANMLCVFFVSGGTGGQPAMESLKKISMAFKFKVIDYVVCGPHLSEEILERCVELGRKLAETVKNKQ